MERRNFLIFAIGVAAGLSAIGAVASLALPGRRTAAKGQLARVVPALGTDGGS